MSVRAVPHLGDGGLWHYPLGEAAGITKIVVEGGADAQRWAVGGTSLVAVGIYDQDGQKGQNWVVTRDGSTITITPPTGVIFADVAYVFLPSAFFPTFERKR